MGHSLEAVREQLIGLEDGILFALLERQKYPQNKRMYARDVGALVSALETSPKSSSFLDQFILEIERVYARFNRYDRDVDQVPFSSSLDLSTKPSINYNKHIKEGYLTHILPQVTSALSEAEEMATMEASYHYLTCAERDLSLLQLLSRRVHLGIHVAEAKFNSEAQHDAYLSLIQAGDRDGLWALLTDMRVEETVLSRIARKSELYFQMLYGISEVPVQYYIQPSVAVSIYRDYIIPWTKEVEVEYLLSQSSEANSTIGGYFVRVDNM